MSVNNEPLKRNYSLSCAKGTFHQAVDFDFEKFEIILFKQHNDERPKNAFKINQSRNSKQREKSPKLKHKSKN